MPLRAALFDMDGTLVRTFIDFPAMRAAMQSLSARYGTSAATSETDDILEIVERIAQALGSEAGTAARTDALSKLEAMEAEGCAHPERIPGASELLYALRKDHGIRIGIITRNSRKIAEDLLGRMDLPYDVLIAREDTPEFKPHPAPVLVACAHLGVAPEDATMTGDLWTDIAAGQAAGVRATIGIQWPHDPPERFARCRPTYEVNSLDEVAELLLGKG